MMNGMGSFGFGGMGFGWIFGLLIIGVIIWAVIKIANGNKYPYSSGRTGGSEDAAEILRRRYAKGEITKEQYETMKRDL